MAIDRRRMPSRIWSGCALEKFEPQMTKFFGESIAGVEQVAGDKGHILFERSVEQAVRVHSRGQSYPEEQAAEGVRPGHFVREISFQAPASVTSRRSP